MASASKCALECQKTDLPSSSFQVKVQVTVLSDSITLFKSVIWLSIFAARAFLDKPSLMLFAMSYGLVPLEIVLQSDQEIQHYHVINLIDKYNYFVIESCLITPVLKVSIFLLFEIRCWKYIVLFHQDQ